LGVGNIAYIQVIVCKYIECFILFVFFIFFILDDGFDRNRSSTKINRYFIFDYGFVINEVILFSNPRKLNVTNR